MDFTLSEEQELVRSTARTLLAKECPPALVRQAIDDPSAADPLWDRLREWVALGDGPLVDHCLFLEETGAVCAPGPYFVTSAIGLPLLRAAGRDWDGSAALSVAWADEDGVWSNDPGGVVRTFVLDADRADLVVAVLPGPAIALVEPPPATPIEWVDLTRRAFSCEVAAIANRGDTNLGPALERATVGLAAEMVGTARWLLDTAVQYAKDRVQFDRPIGSFQAIQHKLADVAVELERAWSAVYYAAMTVDAGDPDRYRAVHVAKAAVGAAVTTAAKEAIQVHGGLGYTWEHDLHLFIRRAYATEHLLGTTAWHHDRLADLLLGTQM